MVVANKKGRRSYVAKWADRKKPARTFVFWSDEESDYLKAACLTDKTYGAIRLDFNKAFPKSKKSRSSVISMAKRMGWAATKPQSEGHGVARGAGALVRTRKINAARSNVGKRAYDKRVVPVTTAPVVFDKPTALVLRSDGDASSQALPKARKTPEEIAQRKLGFLPCIVESKPLTSTAFIGSEHDGCKWPTSDDIRSMEVCGVAATCGAYCDRHALIAYKHMPSKTRNRVYHKDDNEYRQRLGHAVDVITEDIVQGPDKQGTEGSVLMLPKFLERPASTEVRHDLIGQFDE